MHHKHPNAIKPTMYINLQSKQIQPPEQANQNLERRKQHTHKQIKYTQTIQSNLSKNKSKLKRKCKYLKHKHANQLQTTTTQAPT